MFKLENMHTILHISLKNFKILFLGGYSSTARRRRRFLGAFWCRWKKSSQSPPFQTQKMCRRGGDWERYVRIAKTILAVFIESNEMTSSWWKNSFNIFCEAKKWKYSNLSRQKAWIAVKLWRDWSQVIASFLEIKTFSSHSLMDCAVKQCIQHAYSRHQNEKCYVLVCQR